jgi:hypothetical protein
MKFLAMIFACLFFVSCNEQIDLSRDKDVEKILSDGDWRVVEAEKPFTRFQSGLKFSDNNQVFMIDSQGQAIIPMQERLYEISGDTLKIVDYRYEDRFIYSRGTEILLIEELSNKKMVLNVIHPAGPNKLTLEKNPN